MTVELAMTIIGIITPVLMLPLISYIWVRAGRPFDTRFTSDLSLYVASPALFFSGLTRVSQPLAELGLMILATALAIGVLCVIGLVFLKLAGVSAQTYLTSIMLPNMGNIGIPVCYFAFGETGLALALTCTVTMGLMTFSLGIFVTGGQESWHDVFRLPNIYVLMAAGVFLLTETPVPVWLANTTGLLADFAIPLMLLTLGAAIAKMRITHPAATAYVSVLRFVLGACVGWLIGSLLDLSPVMHTILIIECTMPVAVYNFVLAQRYNVGQDQVASTILVTTLASLIILPVMLSIMLPS